MGLSSIATRSQERGADSDGDSRNEEARVVMGKRGVQRAISEDQLALPHMRLASER
jgi:hypothetical protein